MKRGLVLGKFMPPHRGHIGLINYALQYCDELIVLVCATDSEPVAGSKRLEWLQQIYAGSTAVRLQLLCYDETVLPNTSESSVETAELWCRYLTERLPPVDLVVTSEPYGEYMALFWGCEHRMYDRGRRINPVSATDIRTSPFVFRNFLPAPVRPFFVKKICLYGTESTGKSTMARLLADYFSTAYVPETARDIVDVTLECTEEHLYRIAEEHARAIEERCAVADGVLFVDTDILITQSYCRFLFGKELIVDDRIRENSRCDLYLFLDRDAPYIQDGTRLDREQRDALHDSHRAELLAAGYPFVMIGGDWEERFRRAVEAVRAFLGV